jgi:hypothetical protein
MVMVDAQDLGRPSAHRVALFDSECGAAMEKALERTKLYHLEILFWPLDWV